MYAEDGPYLLARCLNDAEKAIATRIALTIMAH